MAGEFTVLDVAFDNVAQANFQPYQVAVLDASNSGTIISAAAIPAATANLQPLGVVYDKAKLDMSGNPVKGSAVNVRVLGVARVVADGAVTPGQFVGTSGTTAGQVHPTTKAAAGAQPQPVLGMAWTQAAAAGDRVVVLLTPGGMY